MIAGIFLLIAGFILLIKGAGLLVTGSSSLAKRLNVPELIIGLTIVAFGTSAPELVVNTVAINYSTSFNIDIGLLVFSTLFVFIAMFTGAKKKFDRWEAILLVTFFLGYLFYLIING